MGMSLSACAPQAYHPPQATLMPAYKENATWKQADPRDDALRENWWELFGDTQLNALESEIAVSNQALRAATAQFEQARAAVRGVRAGGFPQVTVVPGISGAQPSGNRATSPFHSAYSDFVLPLDVSYEVDVWGRVRNALNASRSAAQASAADLQTVSLSLHAELAADYLVLRGLDRTAQLLNDTVQAYERALDLTQNRFRSGIVSRADVELAETQLESTRTQAIDVEVSRSSLEHAIAVLVGRSASSFELPHEPLSLAPPVIPVGVPSELLERRPDIAASERRVAVANAQLGVTTSALYPLLTLSGAIGFESSSFGSWLATASHFWSVTPAAVVTVFDAGRRRAAVAQATAASVQAEAAYGQAVLGAFRDVEDQLSTLRVLDEEATVQARATDAAERALTLATNRYRGGVASYLEVLTAQSAALTNERVGLTVLIRRMTATVQLVKALGGGWNVTLLPKADELTR
jgi:NodT family efflux transporter outer membrane factor (OMF) lipoprotein